MKNLNRRSQGMVEFVIIFGAVLFFLTSILLIVQKNTSQKNLEKESIIAQNIALSVQDEINLASEASDGYYREFRIPETVFGKEYEINIIENSVYLKAKKIGISYKVMNVTGDVKKGVNVIKNVKGVVYLN